MLVLAAGAAGADECTRQIDGYVDAHRTIIGMENVAPDVKSQAAAELQRIEGERGSMTDCELADDIPILKQSKEAFKAAWTATHSPAS
jgi:hypothetical protein